MRNQETLVSERFPLLCGLSSYISIWINSRELAESLPTNYCDRELLIGANIQEAQAGQSRADFFSKIAIALKETRESHYWLKLLAATDILLEDKLKSLAAEAEALIRIISKIIVTSKSKPAR